MAQNSTTTQVYVARQPIFDLNGRVFGYELLYRHGATDTTFVGDRDVASATVLTGALLDVGLDTLTGGRRAFLNLTRPILVNRLEGLLPPDEVIIEVLENVVIDDEVIEACRSLHAKGYQIALDDFVAGSDAEALLPYVAFVKVDVLATPDPDAHALARRLKPRGVGLVAEKVETRWASLWCLAGLNANATPELATLSLLRARTCELVGQALSDSASSELFLVGLFSLLDSMLGVPIATAVEKIPLSDEARQALVGAPNRLRTVLDTVIPYERGEWDDAIDLAATADVAAATLATAHTEALRWVQDVTAS